MYASLGPQPAQFLRAGNSTAQLAKLERDFRRWDRDHGLRFRLENGLGPHNGDLGRVWRMAEASTSRSGDRRRPQRDAVPSFTALHAMFDELLDALPVLFDGDPAPEPPGWELV
jgi:hypothetical protein